MPRLESVLLPVVTDLERGLRALAVPFAVVGALVPELLLEARPTRMTNDADVTVIVGSLADFESLKDRLAEFGFSRTRAPQRMRHHRGGFVDVLPFGHDIAPNGRLELEEGVILNMAGFEHVVPSAVQIAVDGGPTLPLVPLSLYAPLKLVAFNDRQAPKDLAGVFHCLQHYLEDDDRRYGAEHDGVGVPFDYTGAYLLGVDGRSFFDRSLSEIVSRVLDRFADHAADVVGLVARERGLMAVEDDDRVDIFEHFRWYRIGTEL
jgi:predicted nucleotidyltransferase